MALTPEMKKSLETVIVAMANEQTEEAVKECSKYIRMKSREILLGEEKEEKDDDKEDDKEDDKDDDKDEDKDEDEDMDDEECEDDEKEED